MEEKLGQELRREVEGGGWGWGLCCVGIKTLSDLPSKPALTDSSPKVYQGLQVRLLASIL